jgi:uncharacterized membrane-anchored protein
MIKVLRIILILVGLGWVLWTMNIQILKTEKITQDGTLVYLQLRPVDPRALMQGDYMALGYAGDIYPEDTDGLPASGTLVLKLDENAVATYARRDDGTALRAYEIRINYALHGTRVEYGGGRYFFQEGTADAYTPARYGVFRVSPEGRAILVALADENRTILSPTPDDATASDAPPATNR